MPAFSTAAMSEAEMRIKSLHFVPLEYVGGDGLSGWSIVNGSTSPHVLHRVEREPLCPCGCIGLSS